MRIYSDSVYLVIEVPIDLFDKVDQHIIEPFLPTTKYLLANELEIKYLSGIFNKDFSVFNNDYFKIMVSE